MLVVEKTKSGALFRNVSDEILRHIAILEDGIFNMLGDVRVLKAELDKEQKDHEAFLREYYHENEPLFRRLESANEHLIKLQGHTLLPPGVGATGAIKDMEPLTEENENIISSRRTRQIKESQMKQIYHKLAKRFHPDKSSSADGDEDFFHHIKTAYEDKDMKALISLEQNVIEVETGRAEEDPVRLLESLEQEYKTLKDEQKNLREKRSELYKSGSYKLMKRVSWAKSQGRDLLGEIKAQVIAEINTKERFLALHKTMCKA